MNKDYTDPVLPGKKYSSGTTGVTISESSSSSSRNDNNTAEEADRTRQRSASVHTASN
jgi:hypothetical protein